MEPALLTAENISRHFGWEDMKTLALAPLSLEVSRGDFLVITGPSGAGKSTLLHLLSGLDTPSEGSICFQGRELRQMTDSELAILRNREFGFIFQTPHLLYDRTVLENVALPFLYGVSCELDNPEPRCKELLDYVDLKKLANRYPNTLSGGEMQRAVFARAMARGPKVIFADEPTGSLDKENSRRIIELLQDQVKLGRTVIMVTHDQEIGKVGTRFLHLEKVESAAST